jgi:hypothetical protein
MQYYYAYFAINTRLKDSYNSKKHKGDFMLKKSTWALAGLILGSLNVSAMEVHEWGTFTSLVDEKGVEQSGMYHEEVGLPGFVYGLRAQGAAGQLGGQEKCAPPGRPSKCAFSTDKEFVPFNEFNTAVTQKMETPVIYFYGDKGEVAHVEVDFPEGMISQWFPKASSVNLHLQEFKKGFMGWDVTLKGVEDTQNIPVTLANSIWNPARATKSNVITMGAEDEKFIFYRGLGEFTVPLKITLGLESVTLNNTSSEDVSALVYLLSGKVEGVKKFLIIPSLKAGEVRTISTSSAVSTGDLKAEMAKSLVSAGLFQDEALAMLATWNESYFHTEGERLLYILPREWTERILPMRVTPAPAKLERVLVGRVELFSKAAQKSFLTRPLKVQDHLHEAKMNAARD